MGNLLFIFALKNPKGESNFDFVQKSLIWATIGVSLFHVFLPMEWLNEKLFRIKDEDKENELYDEARPYFHTVVKNLICF